MKKILLAAALGLFVFSSCDKDDGDDCETTMASIAGSYKLVSIKYKANAAAPEIDAMSLLPACEQDDIYVANANGTFTVQDAGVACTPSSAASGNWSLSGNTIDLGGLFSGTVTYDCSTLIVVDNDVNVTGDKVTVTLDRQ